MWATLFEHAGSHVRNDMPIGVQIVGGPEEDDRLLRTGSWVLATLNAAEADAAESDKT